MNATRVGYALESCSLSRVALIDATSMQHQAQQAFAAFWLPAAGAQHPLAPPLPQAPGAALASPPKSGTEPSERKLSHAMPCGSVTQYLSDFA